MDYQSMKDQLAVWLSELSRRVAVEDFARFEERDNGNGRLILATANHHYYIAFHPNQEGRSYLGASVSSRIERAGESWTRGNDLHDGDFSRETWDGIVTDILAYELVPLEKAAEGVAPPKGRQTVVGSAG